MIRRVLSFGALLGALGLGSVSASYASDRYWPVPLADGSVRYPFGHVSPRLTCRPLLVCDITLGEQEAILNVAVGDSVRWIVASAMSGPGGTTPHVFVKPTESGLSTNLVVTTTRHTYYIDLTSEKIKGPSRIGFYYPDEERLARRNAALAAQIAAAQSVRTQPTATPVPPKLDFTYRAYGDPSIVPHTVYSDGTHMYLLYESLPQDLPVPYAFAPGVVDQIINYRVNGNTIVVDGLHPGIDLILNAGVGPHGHGDLHAYVRHG